MYHGSRKGFSGGSQKIIEVYSGSHLTTGAEHSAAEGSRGASPQRGPGAAPRWGSRGRSLLKFLTFLPIFEHGLQFRFNEFTYFLEH